MAGSKVIRRAISEGEGQGSEKKLLMIQRRGSRSQHALTRRMSYFIDVPKIGAADGSRQGATEVSTRQRDEKPNAVVLVLSSMLTQARA